MFEFCYLMNANFFMHICYFLIMLLKEHRMRNRKMWHTHKKKKCDQMCQTVCRSCRLALAGSNSEIMTQQDFLLLAQLKPQDIGLGIGAALAGNPLGFLMSYHKATCDS